MHAETVRKDAVMTDLVHAGVVEFQSRRELADLVTEIGEADKFVSGEKMVDAIGKMLRYVTGVVGEGFRCVARLPAVRESLREIPVE